jgi:hypothetical protein
MHTTIGIDACRLQNLVRGRQTDAIDVGQSDFDSLVAWKIDSCDTSHKKSLSLTLLVARVLLADDAHNTGALDHLAMFTDWLDATTDFHRDYPTVIEQLLNI